MPLLVDTHDKCEIDMAAVDDWCRAWSTFFAADSEIVNKGETVVEKQVVYECDGMVVEETAQMSNPAIGLKKMALKQLEAIGHTLGLESTTRASIAKHMTKKFLIRGPAPGLLDPVKKSR